jgi:hypothetical protein
MSWLGDLGPLLELAVAQALQQDLVAQVVAELGDVEAVGRQRRRSSATSTPFCARRSARPGRPCIVGAHAVLARQLQLRLSVIRRSSTSRASCGRGGIGEPCCASCCS